MTKHIDATGKPCPVPVVLTQQAIAAGADQLTVEVDNAAAVENLIRLADTMGFAYAVRPIPGGFALDLSRTGEPAAGEAPAPAPSCAVPPERGGRWVLFVGRDIIGAGDRELGTNLMRMFFYTLTQTDDLPAAVLFMNDGVKLPAGDSQVAEHLRTLQERGAEVLVCGTCLNFYGLTGQLQTGTVSNMYDLVTAMQRADKVLSL